MSSVSWLPLVRAGSLQQELREEIAQLEAQLARFEQLPPERRFASPAVYRQLIAVRQELLALLGDD